MHTKTRRVAPAPHGRTPTWLIVATIAAIGGAAWLLPVAI